MQAYWKFDEGSGTTALDSSGNGHDGTIHGASYVPGLFGTALEFDGINDYVIVSHHNSLNFSTTLSIEFWVKRDDASNVDAIVEKLNTSDQGYRLFIMENSAIRFGGDFGGVWATWDSNGTVPQDKWTHVVVTYDGSYVRFYINGSLDIARPKTGAISGNTADLLIGNLIIPDAYLDGNLDEVRIYNRVLSADEIREHYNTPAVFRVTKEGDVYADRAYYCGKSSGCFNTGTGADIAEYIDVSEPVEPGDVVELDPERPGYYRKSRGAYSTLVAGVVSTTPGMTMGAQAGAETETKSTESPVLRLDLGDLSIGRVSEVSTKALPMLPLNLALLDKPERVDLSLDFTLGNLQSLIGEAKRPLLALMGVVPVKATTENGPIKPGDLLTTSSTPGYAMRCADPQKCDCAIIGKALEPLEEGRGVIKMLVMR